MPQVPLDPGLSQKYVGRIDRIINKNGRFNVKRRGTRFHVRDLYQYLVNLTWPRFLAVTLAGYLVTNTIFAAIYSLIGADHLQGIDAVTPLGRYLQTFFFSAQTITTVGYGAIAPRGFAASFVAAFEAMLGVMGFAVATGLLYGRFSHPSARMVFSRSAVIAPYQNGTSFQFRLVNERTNALMDVEANVLLMTVELQGGQLKRIYRALELERNRVQFMPLTWTVVHPISESSPFFGRTGRELEELQAEVLILVRAYDETYSQNVHALYSYRYDEILWNTRFVPAFHGGDHGRLIVEINRVHETEPVPVRDEG